MSSTTIMLSPDGAITLPPALIESLKLRRGPLRVEVFGDGIAISPALTTADIQRMWSVLGCFKDQMPGITGEEWLNETRGPVELPPEESQ